tara:strand:+ start:299 stop:757 length:459 start_codon:yes stop_codon:yes gene_type:complete
MDDPQIIKMKKSQLDKLIREEISKVLNKSVNEGGSGKPPKSFKVKKDMPYGDDKLYKGIYKLKTSSKGKYVYWNPKAPTTITLDDEEISKVLNKVLNKSVNEGFTKLSDEQKAKVKDGAKKGLSPEDVIDQYFDYDDKYLQSVKALMDKITA